MPIFRSFLFAAGNHPRRVEKCLTLGADAVILDLEDAVANAEKAGTRAVVVEALRRPRRCRGYVRVNALGTAWNVILPMCVIRRMDAVLEPSKEKVLETKSALDEAGRAKVLSYIREWAEGGRNLTGAQVYEGMSQMMVMRQGTVF